MSTDGGFRPVGAVAVGLATLALDGTVLDTWFSAPRLTDSPRSGGTARLSDEEAVGTLGETAARCLGRDDRRGVEVVAGPTQNASVADPGAHPDDGYICVPLLSRPLSTAPYG